MILLGGDRLRGRIAGGRGETLQLELAGGVVLPISIDALAREGVIGGPDLPAADA